MNHADLYKRMNIDLDMVVEAHEVLRGASGKEIPGVKMTETKYSHAIVTTITILDSDGEQYMGRPKGNYITIDAPSVRENNRDVHKEIGLLLGEKLKEVLNLDTEDSVLLVGLGNWNATPDALGPRVVKSSLVTRHLKQYWPDELQGAWKKTGSPTHNDFH